MEEPSVPKKDDHQAWVDYRAALLQQVDVVERQYLKMPLPTADLRLWMSERGPSEKIVIAQVAHIRACGRA